MNLQSLFMSYREKFGTPIGIPMGWSDLDGYCAEIERCIETGIPFDPKSYFPPLPDDCVI